jgi:hypothetical protein
MTLPATVSLSLIFNSIAASTLRKGKWRQTSLGMIKLLAKRSDGNLAGIAVSTQARRTIKVDKYVMPIAIEQETTIHHA